MHAFRLIALAYALVVLLIAPSGLGADTLVADEEPPPTVEAPAAPAETPPVPPSPVEDPAAEPTTTVSEETEESAAEDTPVTTAPEPAPKKKPVAKAAASGSVTITDFEYTPKTITVNEGDTVTWVNKGPTLHTATAEDGSFDTGNLDKGESGSATFTSPGTIAYICTPHPFMKGKVVVKAAAAGNDDSESGDDGDTDDGTAGTAGEDADSDDEDDDDGLPATGFETALIALLGVATLGAGLLLRRRAT